MCCVDLYKYQPMNINKHTWLFDIMKFKGIILVVLVLISPLLYADIVSYIATQQSYLENWFINANIIVLKNQSLIKCSLQCGVLDECMSISYNKGSKECKGVTIGYIVQPTSLGYTSVGWSYFLVLDGKLSTKNLLLFTLLLCYFPKLCCWTFL